MIGEYILLIWIVIYDMSNIYIYVSNISSLTFKNHQQPSDFSTSASHSWPTWQVQDSCVDVGLSEGWVLEDPQSSPWVSILSHESWSNLCRWLEEDFRKPPTMHKKEHSESCKCVCWWVKTYMFFMDFPKMPGGGVLKFGSPKSSPGGFYHGHPWTISVLKAMVNIPCL
jgi:hypothetical protein